MFNNELLVYTHNINKIQFLNPTQVSNSDLTAQIILLKKKYKNPAFAGCVFMSSKFLLMNIN